MDRKRILLYIAIGIIIIAAIVSLSLLFAPSEEEKNHDNNGTVIGVCFGDLEADQVYAQQVCDALHAKGYTTRLLDAGNDQSKQNGQIKDLAEEGCDGLIVNMVMTSTAEELTNLVKQYNIPTVLIGSAPDPAYLSGWERICFVGCDPNQPGKLQADVICHLPNGGDINDDGILSYLLLQDSPEKISTSLRTDSALKALSAAGIQLNELARVPSCENRDSAQRFAAKHLSEMGKDIELILCNCDEAALGAITAIADGGRHTGVDIYVLGIGGTKEAIQEISQGQMTATVMDHQAQQAEKAVEVLDVLLADGSVEKQYWVDHIAVTKENAKEFLN